MNILIHLQYILFIIIILIVQRSKNSIYEESKYDEEEHKTDEDCKNDGAQYLFATSIQQHEATKEVCYILKYKYF